MKRSSSTKEMVQVKDSTGIVGLDHVLRGGLTKDRLYVIEGDPGSGKTTLAMQFLLDGVRQGQTVLYVTLSESLAELREVADSHGWDLTGVNLLELDSLAERLERQDDYTVYHPADVELGETIQRICDEVERLNPERVALDSVSELKILAQSGARYRREILGLKQFFSGRRCTVLVLDDLTNREGEQQLQSVAHGVIRMERKSREYGDTRRQLHVVKMRGVRFREGHHDFIIETGGVQVYPRLSASEYPIDTKQEKILSGVKELDALLGGGLDRGSSALVLGPAGCGKTTLCAQYLMAALERGEKCACYVFEESRNTFLARSAGMHMVFGPYIEAGLLELQQVDPAELSPGEFAYRVRAVVEHQKARIVVIDSINGYLNAMPSESFLLIQLHELLTYLGQQGVLTLLVMSQMGMLGTHVHAPIDISFLADSVVLLRFFEAFGEIRQAISVVKKRLGPHERTLRELKLGPRGVQIGPPLHEFEGVLTGVPRYHGKRLPANSEQA